MSPPRFMLPSGPMSRTSAMFRHDALDGPMALEMNTNSRSQVAKRIKELNNYSVEKCIADYTELPIWQQLLGMGITPNACIENQVTFHAAAMLVWAEVVRPNAVWDHKPKISSRFNPRLAPAPQYWHAHSQTEYLYDVWSNMHYGYVGMAVGFDEDVLLDGAGLAQLLSDMVKQKKLPSGYDAHQGFRRFDPLSDRAAIRMGVNLYKSNPGSVHAAELLKLILGSSAITFRKLQP